MAKDKVTEILLNRLLSFIEKENTLPWAKPWIFKYAFNYYTGHVYKGINRWLLPTGEYMTKNQLNKYNEENGTNYKFKKGIEWIPALFMKTVKSFTAKEELPEEVIQEIMSDKSKVIKSGSNTYFFDKEEKRIMKSYLLRRFYLVAEIKWFVDENGNTPPSKVESGLVEFTYEEPENVINRYVSREGVGIKHALNEAYYIYSEDCVYLPKKTDFKNEDSYYSTLFHELAHSTGAEKRLNRDAITKRGVYKILHERSKEELIAEMCSCLVCVETGIYEIRLDEESNYFALKNSESYVKAWYKYLKSGEEDIVYLASDAEKASKFILGESVDQQEEFADKMKQEFK